MYKTLFKLHKWIGVVAALILVNAAVTGGLLLVKKQFAWIQPAEQKGSAPHAPAATFDAVLAALRSVPAAEVSSWRDVARIDVRPNKSLIKATCANGLEVQLDAADARVLQSAVRRSDLIEQIHDGSYFGDAVHGWVMPVVAASLAFLSLSGVYLFLAPWLRRRKRGA